MENIERVKRIAAIHDISGFGKCSLTVALPVVSATGVECSCIPTALLSTHTGEFTGWTRRDLTDQMLPIARHWHQLGIRFDGVYSGYLASPAQERVLEEVYGLIAGEGTLIVCDPAMADNGSYYTGFGHDMRDTFRRLCAHSHVITPNITEAALLAGEEYRPAPHSREYLEHIFEGLAALGPRVIAVTGVHDGAGRIGTVVLERETGRRYAAMREELGGVFYGTGDIFASAFAALLTRGACVEKSLELASALVAESIGYTYRQGTPRRDGVAFELALPNYVRRVGEAFGDAQGRAPATHF